MHHGFDHTGEDSHAALRDLMMRVQQKDTTAFESLYDQLSDTVYSIAMKYLTDPVAAQDVLQEVFVRLWEQPQAYNPALGKVVAWMVTLTRNHCLNRIRSEQRRSSAHVRSAVECSATAPLATSGAAVNSLLEKEKASEVHEALRLLPPDQAEAIRLAFFNNMTHESAAASLQVPLGTLKARIRRGLQRMREELQHRR